VDPVGQLAAWVGRFVGAVLRECGPTIVDILAAAIRAAINDTVEDGATRDDLRTRLLERVRDSRGFNTPRRTDSAPRTSEGKDLGG